MLGAQRLPIWAGAFWVALVAVPMGSSALRTRDSPHLFRQELINHKGMDLQYTAEMTLGGEKMLGVLDTGSFELLAFGSKCMYCGELSKLYDHSKSITFKEGPLSMVHSFGSGDVYTNEGFEQLKIGPLIARNMSFWEAYQANMPLLMNSNFQAIVGMGPPGRPEHDAEKVAKKEASMVSQYKHNMGHVPAWVQQKADDSEIIAKIREHEINSVPEAFGASVYSVCYGSKTGSPGYFVWNDDSAVKQPSLFTTVPVKGDYTWSSSLTDVRLKLPNGEEMPFDLGCSKGCGALVDSGTSLLVVPSAVALMVRSAVSGMGAKCDDLSGSGLPSLVFKLGGQDLYLPPQAFLGYVKGTAPSSMTGLIGNTSTSSCNLDVTMMTSNQETQYGPLWILGMPFMRHYYTTFDLGSLKDVNSTSPPPDGQRNFRVALASEGCQPTGSNSTDGLNASELQLKTVDAAHVRVSNWVGKATRAPTGFVPL